MVEDTSLTVRGLLRSSLKFNTVNLTSKAISFLSTLVVAAVLTPEEYGVIGFVTLWSLYATLISPGMDLAAQREMAYMLGKNQTEKALHFQNVSIAYTFLFSVAMFAVIFSCSFIYSDALIRYGLMITALSYFVSVNCRNWPSFNYVRQRFNIVAIGTLITGLSSPLLSILLVSWLRVYAVLIAPIAAVLLSLIFYLKKDGIDLHLEFDRDTAVKLLRIGIPLAWLSMAYWAYRIIDKTLIAWLLPLYDLGFYTLITAIVNALILLFSDFANVLQPVLYTSLGKSENHDEQYRSLYRIAVYLSISAAVIVSVSQVGFYFLTNLLLTKYVASVPVFNVLAFNIFMMSLSIIPGVVLTSTVVNRQRFSALVWGMGLAVAFVLDYFAIATGSGILGVSLATVASQIFITAILFYSIRDYIFRERNDFSRFVLKIISPVLISILFFAITLLLGRCTQDPILFTAVSSAILVTIWLLVIRVFYRDYFPKEKILRGLKKPLSLISSRGTTR